MSLDPSPSSPTTSQAKKSSPVCFDCQEPITGGKSYMRVKDFSFHQEHFKCKTCRKNLSGEKFYVRDEAFRCAKCYEIEYCPPCDECGERISGGSLIKALGKFYHQGHFRCATCKVKLEGKYFTRDNKPYCSKHASAGPTETCAQCGEDVEQEDFIKAAGKAYHKKCLSCFHCKRPLAKNDSLVFRKDDNLYCQEDFQELFSNRCTACGGAILNDCISVNAEFYHGHCFNCAQCGKKLDKYLSIGGELRCSDHVSASAMKVTCVVCNESIPVHRVVAAAGKRFHIECFRCSYCQKNVDKVNAKLRDNLLCCSDCLVSSSITTNLPSNPPRTMAAKVEARIQLLSLTHTAAEFKKAVDEHSIPKEKEMDRAPTQPGINEPKHQRNVSVPVLEMQKDMTSTNKSAIGTANSSDSIKVGKRVQEREIKPAPVDNQNPTEETVASKKQLKKKRSPRSSSFTRVRHRKTPTWSANSSENQGIKWRKGELIGKGSFGKVYMGMLITGELIAVKQVELKSNEDQENAKQLQSEIRLMEKLRHPNIVALLGTERKGTMFNILMEYVPGKSIDVLLDSFGPFQEETIQSYTVQLVSALEYMHRNDIIHRDIKGKNILVDTNGNLKLADFGSAKQFDNILSKEAPSISYNYTPLWTAPEVLLGNYGRKVDVWSLGCVLIEMATAKTPWAECNFQNPFRALYHIGNSNGIPQIPESMGPVAKDFIRKCLTRSPDQRPDAKDLMSHEFIASAFDSSEEEEDDDDDASVIHDNDFTGDVQAHLSADSEENPDEYADFK